jgi:hypothetical protein
MSDWQPIATLPRDGSTVLVWFGQPYLRIMRTLRTDGGAASATHWMPLPEPPPAHQEKGGER